MKSSTFGSEGDPAEPRVADTHPAGSVTRSSYRTLSVGSPNARSASAERFLSIHRRAIRAGENRCMEILLSGPRSSRLTCVPHEYATPRLSLTRWTTRMSTLGSFRSSIASLGSFDESTTIPAPETDAIASYRRERKPPYRSCQSGRLPG
jgi:hypothetical protein